MKSILNSEETFLDEPLEKTTFFENLHELQKETFRNLKLSLMSGFEDNARVAFDEGYKAMGTNPVEAEALFRIAIDLSNLSTDGTVHFKALLFLGKILSEKSSNEANRYLEIVFEHIDTFPSLGLLASIELSDYWQDIDPSKAMAYLVRAVRFIDFDKHIWVAVAYKLANLLAKSSIHRAIEYYELAAQNIDANEVHGYWAALKAGIILEASNPEKAMRFYNKVLKYCPIKEGAYCHALIGKGNIYRGTDLDRAIECWQEAFDLPYLPDKERLDVSLYLGSALANDHRDSAKKFWQTAYDLKALDQKAGVIASYNLGLYYQNKDLEKAHKYYQNAVDNYEYCQEVSVEAATELGFLLRKHNRSLAAFYLNFSVRHGESNRKASTAAAYHLGNLLSETDKTKAKLFYRQAVDSLSHNRSAGTAAARELGDLLALEGLSSYENVEMLHIENYNLYKSLKIENETNKLVFLSEFVPAEAIKYYRIAVHNLEHNHENGMMAARAIGLIFRKTNPEKAIRYYDIAVNHIDYSKEIGAAAAYEIGLLLKHVPKKAEQYFSIAVDFIKYNKYAGAGAAAQLATMLLNQNFYNAMKLAALASENIEFNPEAGALGALLLGTNLYERNWLFARQQLELASHYSNVVPFLGLAASFYYGKFIFENNPNVEDSIKARNALINTMRDWKTLQTNMAKDICKSVDSSRTIFVIFHHLVTSAHFPFSVEMLPFLATSEFINSFGPDEKIPIRYMEDLPGLQHSEFGIHQYSQMLSTIAGSKVKDTIRDDFSASQGVVLVYRARMVARVKRLILLNKFGISADPNVVCHEIRNDIDAGINWCPSSFHLSTKVAWVLESFFDAIQDVLKDTEVAKNFGDGLITILVDYLVKLFGASLKRNENDSSPSSVAVPFIVDVIIYLLRLRDINASNEARINLLILKIIEGRFVQTGESDFHSQGCSLILNVYLLANWSQYGTCLPARFSNYSEQLTRAEQLADYIIAEISDRFLKQSESGSIRKFPISEGSSEFVALNEATILKRTYDKLFRSIIDLQSILFLEKASEFNQTERGSSNPIDPGDPPLKPAHEKFVSSCLSLSALNELVLQKRSKHSDGLSTLNNIECDTISRLREVLKKHPQKWISLIFGIHYAGSFTLLPCGDIEIKIQHFPLEQHSGLSNIECRLNEAYKKFRRKTSAGRISYFLSEFIEKQNFIGEKNNQADSTEFKNVQNILLPDEHEDVEEESDILFNESLSYLTNLTFSKNHENGPAEADNMTLCASSILADIPWTGLGALNNRCISQASSAHGYLYAEQTSSREQPSKKTVVILTSGELWRGSKYGKNSHVPGYEDSLSTTIKEVTLAGHTVLCIHYSDTQNYTSIYEWNDKNTERPIRLSECPKDIYPNVLVLLVHGIQDRDKTAISLNYSSSFRTTITDDSMHSSIEKKGFEIGLNFFSGEDILPRQSITLHLDGCDIISAACLVGRIDPRFEYESLGWIREFQKLGAKRIFAANWEVATSEAFGFPELISNLIVASTSSVLQSFSQTVRQWSNTVALNSPYVVRTCPMVFNDF